MPIEGSLEARIRARLAALQSRQLLRTPRPPSGIDLSSNDYLNLSKDPRVTEAFIRGVATGRLREHGLAPASRRAGQLRRDRRGVCAIQEQ